MLSVTCMSSRRSGSGKGGRCSASVQQLWRRRQLQHPALVVAALQEAQLACWLGEAVQLALAPCRYAAAALWQVAPRHTLQCTALPSQSAQCTQCTAWS